MNFPLLIKTSTPLEVLGIIPDEKIFFSPQTDLSDLLGQYRPHGSDFVWHDESLLRCVKNGGIAALIDLNMAQQQVI
jgi:midasin (ATPase involved in ribosome maturation)